MPPPAHTPQAAPREPAPPPTLPQELLALVASLTRRLTDLEQHQIPQLAQCKGPLTLHEQLAAEVRQEMTGMRKDVEELKLQVDDLDKARDRRAGADHVVAIQLRVETVTKQYRQAVIASKKLIDASGVLSARDELFSSAAKAGAQEVGKGLGGIARSSSTRGANGDKGPSSGQGEDDALMSATSDVTEGLRRTLQLMQQEVDRSMMSNEMLVLNTSKALITALERADLLDRLILLAAMLLFGLVCAWIFKRRVVNRGIRVATALSHALSRGEGRKVVAEAVEDVKHDLRQAVKSASEGIRSDATQAAVVVTSVVASAVHAAKTAVVSQREERSQRVSQRLQGREATSGNDAVGDGSILDKIVERVPGTEDVVNDWFGEGPSKSNHDQYEHTILERSGEAGRSETVLDKIKERVPGAHDIVDDWFGDEEPEEPESQAQGSADSQIVASEPEAYTDEVIGADSMPRIVAELYQNATSPSEPDDEVQRDPEAIESIISIAESGLVLDEQAVETGSATMSSTSTLAETPEPTATTATTKSTTSAVSQAEQVSGLIESNSRAERDTSVVFSTSENVPSEYPAPPSASVPEPAPTAEVPLAPTPAPSETAVAEIAVEDSELDVPQSAAPPEEPSPDHIAMATASSDNVIDPRIVSNDMPATEPTRTTTPSSNQENDGGLEEANVGPSPTQSAAAEPAPESNLADLQDEARTDEEREDDNESPDAQPVATAISEITGPVFETEPSEAVETMFTYGSFGSDDETLPEGVQAESIVTVFDGSTPTHATRNAEDDTVFTPKPFRPAVPDLEDRQAIIDENWVERDVEMDVGGERREDAAASDIGAAPEDEATSDDGVAPDDAAAPDAGAAADDGAVPDSIQSFAPLEDDASDEQDRTQDEDGLTDVTKDKPVPISQVETAEANQPVARTSDYVKAGADVADPVPETAYDDVVRHLERDEYIEPPDEPEPFTVNSIEELGAEYDEDVLEHIATRIDQEQALEEENEEEEEETEEDPIVSTVQDDSDVGTTVTTVFKTATATETTTIELPMETAPTVADEQNSIAREDVAADLSDVEALESESFEGVNDPDGVTMPAVEEPLNQVVLPIEDEAEDIVDVYYEPVPIPDSELEYVDQPAVQEDEEEMDHDSVVGTPASTATASAFEDADEPDEVSPRGIEQDETLAGTRASHDEDSYTSQDSDRARDEL
ncbi:Protein transport protein sec20 [Microbotryomycetes sp. JL201]|nr:Protein transport protein sec20 [Microbotryomycetes sp. JL201]